MIRLDPTTKKFIDATADAIVILDDQLRIRHLSTTAQRLFLLEPAVVGQPIRELLADCGQTSVTDEQLRKGFKSRTVKGVTAKGQTIAMSLSVGEARVRGDRLYVCVFRDLSGQEDSYAQKISAENLNHALMEAAVDGIITIDEQGLIRSFNSAAENLFGYARTDVIGENVRLLMPGHYARHHDEYIRTYVNSGHAKIIGIGRDVEGMRRDGSKFPMHLSVGEAQFHGTRHFIGICHDLSEYRHTLEKLARAEQRYRDIVDSQSQLICRVDEQLRITFANLTFSRCLKTSPQKLIGTPLYEFAEDRHPELKDVLKSLFRSSRKPGNATLKLTMEGADDKVSVIEWSFSLTGKSDGIGPELQGLGIDVSEYERARNRAEYLQNHDALTGLFNKSAFIRELGMWVDVNRPFSLLHIDLENFGLINHRFGYEAGNSALRSFAEHLRTKIGNDGLCARAGADDFLAAVPIVEIQGLVDFISSFNSDIGPVRIVGERSVHMETLVGIATFPDDGLNPERLPDLAESAMRDARQRREPYAFFNEQSQGQLERRMDLQQGLTQALENDGLTISLQPKWHAISRRIAGFEALVRWFDPDLGQVSPAEFIPVAEQSKLGQTLDRYVIRKAIGVARALKNKRQSAMPVAVNITATHFANPAFPDFVLTEIEKAGLAPTALELELTEGVIIEGVGFAGQALSQLRDAGIRVAIDDFGTGYSSLAYLRHLNVDELKIDKQFVDEVSNERGGTVLQSVINIAKAYDLSVTAEGVESLSQLEALEHMGCDLIQGYYLSKPLSVADALSLVDQAQSS